jgi:hypothetical protein
VLQIEIKAPNPKFQAPEKLTSPKRKIENIEPRFGIGTSQASAFSFLIFEFGFLIEGQWGEQPRKMRTE